MNQTTAEIQARYRAKHRDELKAKSAAYNAAHPGRGAAWNRAHPERRRRNKARYIEAHRDELAVRRVSHPWRRANHALGAARQAARDYGLDPGSLTKEVFARLHLLPCAYCGVMPAGGADHVIPLSRGGPNALSNLVPACLPCNQKKGVA